jgi:hypothetical protein
LSSQLEIFKNEIIDAISKQNIQLRIKNETQKLEEKNEAMKKENDILTCKIASISSEYQTKLQELNRVKCHNNCDAKIAE